MENISSILFLELYFGIGNDSSLLYSDISYSFDDVVKKIRIDYGEY